VAVAKGLTSTCTIDELRSILRGAGKVAADLADLVDRLAPQRRAGRRVVLINGCFDLLHAGHVAVLEAARSLGDVLVVAVNSDDGVRRLKGAGRPVNNAADRLGVLAALGPVDHLVLFEEDTAERVLRAVRPDVYAKGGDYREDILPEAEVARAIGAELRILPEFTDRSTSQLIERILAMPGGGAA
jgi:D-beta-D-heptose 7-phosphate kinase/D-beta-D-heptose 1-phosphate adenosyltransferase